MKSKAKITIRQRGLYWRTWREVQAAVGDEATDELRHDIHARMLGHDKSSNDFTQDDLDKVLGEFFALKDPANIGLQLRQINQKTTRMRWLAQKQKRLLAVFVENPEAYIDTLLKERFGFKRVEDLPDQPMAPYKPSPLKQYIMTLAARIDKMRQEAGLTTKEMEKRANPTR